MPKTVSGLLKLLYPHGEFDKEAVRQCLEYALEVHRQSSVSNRIFKIDLEILKKRSAEPQCDSKAMTPSSKLHKATLFVGRLM